MTRIIVALAALALVAPAAGAEAQSTGGEWWTPVANRAPADAARAANGREARRGNGPPFCRNGQGHPVHGPQWCREKGWGGSTLGAVWRDVSWEDVILGPRSPRRKTTTLDRGGLIDVLGDVVLGRLESLPVARREGSLSGRFLGDGAILQIRAGGTPLAELFDANGDGRVDRVLLSQRD